MTSKQKILQKLRNVTHKKDNTPLPSHADNDFFRDMPENNPDALVEQFSKRLTALSGEFYAVANETEAAEKLFSILDSNGKCLVQKHEMLKKICGLNEALKKCCAFLDGELDGSDFAKYTAGISVADFLVARTGSIVLRNTTAGGRRLSVLPPLHIVLARQSQLMPSLDHALQAIETDNHDWSYAAIITGPSRTADIQKNIVLGAHGPKRLAVVLIN